MWKFYFFHSILSFLIFWSSGNDELFAKFHQNAYKIKDYRIEVEDYNKNYYTSVKIKTFKYNRSVAAANITSVYKIDVDGTKLEVLVQVFKWASNEYRVFPIRFQINLYKAIKANIIGASEVLKCGNMPKDTLYFKKDVVYLVCNFVPDERHFPPLIPSGRYRVQYSLLLGNQILVIGGLYLEIYVPIKY